MPSQSGIGFAGGLASGLAQSLYANRERQRIQDEKSQRNAQLALNFLIQSGQVGDIADVGPLFDHAFGFDKQQGGKKGKPQNALGVDPREATAAMLNHALSYEPPQGAQAPTGGATGLPPEFMPVQPENAAPGVSQPAPVALQTPSPMAPAGPAPRRSLLGIPLLSPEEAVQRQTQMEIGTEGAKMEARIRLAKDRILPALQAVDGSATMEDALRAVGVKEPMPKRFTPGPVGGVIDAKEVPEGSTDPSGNPIDTTKAKAWQAVRDVTGDLHYIPGTMKSTAGKASLEQSYYDQWAKENIGPDATVADMTTEQRDRASKTYHSSRWASSASEEAKQARAKDIAGAIENHTQPPDMSRMYGLSAYVRDELAKKGLNLVQMTEDWTATQRYINSLNSTQQLNLRQKINQLPGLLDSVEELAKQWKGGKYALLNKANLAAAKNGLYGQEAASVARQLDAQIADVTTDLATIYRGGGAATNDALRLAEKNLSSDWSEKVLLDAIDLARKNVNIRKGSLEVGPGGASVTNPYYQPAAPTAPPKSTAPQAKKDKNGNWILPVP